MALHQTSPTEPLQEANQNVKRPKRKSLRNELMAEVIGSAVVIIFGNGVVAAWNVVEDTKPWSTGQQHPDIYAKGTYTNLAWGLGVTFGVMVSFNTSGAILNSALQFKEMCLGCCTIRRGFAFIGAQTFGYFLGALLMTLNFVVLKEHPKIHNFYCTSPGNGTTALNAALNEFIATLLLALGLHAITNNRPAFDKFSVAAFAGALVFAIGQVFNGQSGYAINPARDFGPRLCYLIFALIYGGVDIWQDVMGSGYFIVPILVPPLGALAGALLYKHCIFLEDLDDVRDSRRESEP